MDGKEIERKWLIRQSRIPYDLTTLPARKIEQCYLCYSPTLRIRSFDDGKDCVLTLKTPSQNGGLTRGEWEVPLSDETYKMLRAKAEGNPVLKTRYVHKLENGLKEEIDLFEGELQGLAYLEIEFPDEESAAAYPSPEWAVREVTHDHSYSNARLSRNGMPENAMKD